MFFKCQGKEPILCPSTQESSKPVFGGTRMSEGGTNPKARAKRAPVITRGAVPFTCVYIPSPQLQKHKRSADQLSAKMKCVSRNSFKERKQLIQC